MYAVDGDVTINLNENNEAAVVDDEKNVCKTKNPKSKTKKSKDFGKELNCFIKCLFLNYFNTITKVLLQICLDFVYAVDGDETINLNENNMLNNEATVVDEGKNVCKTKNPKIKTKKSNDLGKELYQFFQMLFYFIFIF